MSKSIEDGSLEKSADQESRKVRFEIAGIPIPLRRTFGAIDRLFALPIEALADTLESKIKSNIQQHLDAVQKVRKKRGAKQQLNQKDISIGAARSIAKWAEAASDIGPDQKELSSAWQAILDRLLSNPDDAEELLDAVQSVPRSDLRVFLDSYTFPYGRFSRLIFPLIDDEAIQRLRACGLLRRTLSNTMVAFWGMVVFLLLYACVAILMREIVGGALPTAVVIVAMAVMLMLRAHSPTRMGSFLTITYANYIMEKQQSSD